MSQEKCCGTCKYHEPLMVQLVYQGRKVPGCTNPDSIVCGYKTQPTDGTDCPPWERREEE